MKKHFEEEGFGNEGEVKKEVHSKVRSLNEHLSMTKCASVLLHFDWLNVKRKLINRLNPCLVDGHSHDHQEQKHGCRYLCSFTRWHTFESNDGHWAHSPHYSLRDQHSGDRCRWPTKPAINRQASGPFTAALSAPFNPPTLAQRWAPQSQRRHFIHRPSAYYASIRAITDNRRYISCEVMWRELRWGGQPKRLTSDWSLHGWAGEGVNR